MFAPIGFDNEKFKTELCVKFQELGACPYNTRCRFAHGEAELRAKPKPKQYKTKPCNNFIRTGQCAYGVRCNFLHDDALHQNNTQSTNIISNNPLMNTNVNTMTFQQRMRSHQQQGWENFMTGLKHSSGCYNVKTVSGFHCERPPISERFQAWKEMRGEGELPMHVLILKDNKQWIIQNDKKEKSKQLLLTQQQQLKQLSKLLLPKHNSNINDNSEAGSDGQHNDNNNNRRHKRHRYRYKRKKHIKIENECDDVDEDKRSRSRDRSDNDGEKNDDNDIVVKKENECDVEKSPSLDDEELSSSINNNVNDNVVDEMPLPE